MKRMPFLLGPLIIGLLCSPSSAADEILLLAGFAKIDITPAKPVSLAGYEDRKDLSAGMHDPLSARASVFQSGDRRIVLVSCDVLEFTDGTSGVFRRHLMEELRHEPQELFLSTVHTHAGPPLTLDDEHGHPIICIII